MTTNKENLKVGDLVRDNRWIGIVVDNDQGKGVIVRVKWLLTDKGEPYTDSLIGLYMKESIFDDLDDLEVL